MDRPGTLFPCLCARYIDRGERLHGSRSPGFLDGLKGCVDEHHGRTTDAEENDRDRTLGTLSSVVLVSMCKSFIPGK